ncbi:MAG: phage integrase SAM-like domain-containing protein [Bacteroidales bacterium]|nr:phage integrase SAM-like domain-containing protein [Bacteroidales bacterium]
MASISKSLSSVVDARGKSEILLRLSVARGKVFRAPSGLFVSPARWKAGAFLVPRLETPERRELLELKNRLEDLERFILDALADLGKADASRPWLIDTIDRFHHPDRPDPSAPGFFPSFQEYIDTQKVSDLRRRHYAVIMRALQRWEQYRGAALTLDGFSKDDIRAFEDFLGKEHELAASRRWRGLYDGIPANELPGVRSRNTIIDYLIILRAFLHWARHQGKTRNDPFDGYTVGSAVYGTPYYITMEERDRIYRMNLRRHPELAAQRDIFVFQCLTGPRVADMLAFEKGDVVDGVLTYIPGKTAGSLPHTVRVPLNETAREIVSRYADLPGRQLLPFIAAQNYNYAIKRIFRAARITRLVSVLDPVTRREVKRPLNEIASSHLARRTFIGNLYKQVKDPALVGALSGHAEGSTAFARYRDIDDEMKTGLVELLEVKK